MITRFFRDLLERAGVGPEALDAKLYAWRYDVCGELYGESW